MRALECPYFCWWDVLQFSERLQFDLDVIRASLARSGDNLMVVRVITPELVRVSAQSYHRTCNDQGSLSYTRMFHVYVKQIENLRRAVGAPSNDKLIPWTYQRLTDLWSFWSLLYAYFPRKHDL